MTKFDMALKRSYRMISEVAVGDLDIPGMEGYDRFMARKEKESGKAGAAGEPVEKSAAPIGMVPCEVERHHTAWLVVFDDGSDMLFQTDYDQAAFASSSADAEGNPVVDVPPEWDGSPSSLPGFHDIDPSDIAYCLSDYKDQAESEGREYDGKAEEE